MTKPTRHLVLNTSAFTVCFAAWLLYAVLIKFLTQHGIYEWSETEVGILMGTPVLSGATLRLPVGLLTDRFGGRPVFTGVMLTAALGACSVTLADGFWGFLLAGLLFGVAGAAFAVGIAYTSVWYERSRQGTALGVFGAGNAGAALTLLVAPKLLQWLAGTDPQGWRALPVVYATSLLVMSTVFWLHSENRKPADAECKSLAQRLAPLARPQVWRFGLYYFLVFGGFVGLSGWLVKYYVDVYSLSLATAGVLASVFSLPSAVIRALGGWWADRQGARPVMYFVLGTCVVGCGILCLRVDIVTFTVIACTVGIAMGIGMAAVYKHIPTYFPNEVGVVGGLVGVLGGLGGFVCPIVFGGLLDLTRSPENPLGVWTTSWMLLAVVSAGCLTWMHTAIRRIEARRAAPLEGLQPTAH